MTALLSLYSEERKRRAMDGREKRRRAESTYRGDNRLNCQIHTFSSVPCVCVCVRVCVCVCVSETHSAGVRCCDSP